MFSTLIVPPALEPITLEEAKAQCKITHSAEDALLRLYIAAARRAAESYTRRAFLEQTRRIVLDAFPDGPIELDHSPLIAIDEVSYIDGAGETVLLLEDEFTVHADLEYPRVAAAYASEWPIPRDYMSSISVLYRAGFGNDPIHVPEDIRIGILLLVGHYYVNRGAVVSTNATEIPLGAMRHLDPWRIRRVA